MISDQQIIEILAKREGLQKCGCKDPNCGAYLNSQDEAVLAPDYLHSLDSLQPILMKLTEEEWEKLFNILEEELSKFGEAEDVVPLFKKLVLMKPRQLAFCICNVIAENGGGE